MEGLSFGGFVLGMAATAVNPPATAAAAAGNRFSFFGTGLAQMRECRRIRGDDGDRWHQTPGYRYRLGQWADFAVANDDIGNRVELSRRIDDSPFFTADPLPPAADENRHTDRNAGRNLIEDYGERPVRNIRGNLNAAIHRSWMHDNDVRLRPLGALAAEAVIAEVFAHGWENDSLIRSNCTRSIMTTSAFSSFAMECVMCRTRVFANHLLDAGRH
jgi:hypothetical protein